MSKLLLLDNYDSFTYNLLHYLEALTEQEIVVLRNDEMGLSQLEEFDSLVISPGPGLPEEAGKTMEVLHHFITKGKKILGICLGHQAIARHFGLNLINLGEVVHGQSRKLIVQRETDLLFRGLPKVFMVGRYHSWIAENEPAAGELVTTAVDESGNSMAMAHKSLPIWSVQFHPESILSEHGKAMLTNWLNA